MNTLSTTVVRLGLTLVTTLGLLIQLEMVLAMMTEAAATLAAMRTSHDTLASGLRASTRYLSPWMLLSRRKLDIMATVRSVVPLQKVNLLI